MTLKFLCMDICELVCYINVKESSVEKEAELYIFIQTILSSTSSPLGLLSAGNRLQVEWLSPGYIWTCCEL